ncbi:hypothetical protein HPNQ4216_1063 [Helicobacter pylori NQ4216]|nr:hypothetical protein HPNQ4216_1063 [Helicobacter pylori NQ4216]
MLILTYSQMPLRALKNGVFKFRAIIAYHHLTFIYKGRFKP